MGIGGAVLLLAIAVRLVRGSSAQSTPGAAPRRKTPGRPSAPRPTPAATDQEVGARADPEPGRRGPRGTGTDASVLSSSAVMAAGTVVSRLSGFVRNALLGAALGQQLHADVFTIANTVPNMLYILLAGGVFNAVLVPQLVRAMKNDPDGGDGYTNRIITLAALFLAGVTAVLVIAAPLLMRVFLDDRFFAPELALQRESVIDFARYCLPQVFFYGMFVLVGQVLNSRGSFGPMMWAPIANNVISVAVLGVYLWSFGPVRPLPRRRAGPPVLAGPGRRSAATPAARSCCSASARRWASPRSCWILLPYLRAGRLPLPAALRLPRHRPRATPCGWACWTVLFVVVNQIAYTVVVRIASGGTADAVGGACVGGGTGTGYTIYSNAFLLVMVPHSIATVSLATAMLPRLSASRRRRPTCAASPRSVASTLRTSYALIIPFALLLPRGRPRPEQRDLGYGAARQSVADFALALALFAPGWCCSPPTT